MLRQKPIFEVLYPNDLKSWEFGKAADTREGPVDLRSEKQVSHSEPETPQIWPGEADAIAAKLKKFSDAGGDKFCGCPTTPKTNFSSCLGISLCLLSLTSCSHSHSWNLQKVQAEDPAFSSSKLIYAALHAVRPISLEMIQMQEGLHTYLCLYAGPVVNPQDHPDSVFIQLSVEDKVHLVETHRHAGGERLLFTPEAQDLLLKSLLAHQTVTITLPGYQIGIDPKDFKDFFKKIEEKSTMTFPFQFRL